MKISRDNTNKKKIINNISSKIGLPSSYAKKIVDDVILILISNIVIKKIFKIKNFGTFSLRKKNKRIGRNPKSKINHPIIERNVITFKSAENLKKKLNTYVRK
jgi:integration host factor subunit alpha|tara:strand:- start:12 stop:320 length:309 start_codon:yes stop_codon:yes gene_type:complete